MRASRRGANRARSRGHPRSRPVDRCLTVVIRPRARSDQPASRVRDRSASPYGFVVVRNTLRVASCVALAPHGNDLTSPFTRVRLRAAVECRPTPPLPPSLSSSSSPYDRCKKRTRGAAAFRRAKPARARYRGQCSRPRARACVRKRSRR